MVRCFNDGQPPAAHHHDPALIVLDGIDVSTSLISGRDESCGVPTSAFARGPFDVNLSVLKYDNGAWWKTTAASDDDDSADDDDTTEDVGDDDTEVLLPLISSVVLLADGTGNAGAENVDVSKVATSAPCGGLGKLVLSLPKPV